jgi:hypothetical protein
MNPSSSSGGEPLLHNLCSLLSRGAGPLSIPALPPSLAPPATSSHLLTSLLRAACYIDLASGRRDSATQTDPPLPPSPDRRRSPRRQEDEGRGHHKKRKRKKEPKPRKRKKEKRRNSCCSSPSYSDYEPENPILRRKLR